VLGTQRWLSLRQEIFLEPSVRNASRGTLKLTACDFVWHPHMITYPFTCPLPQDKLWVETTTAFHQDLLIIRSFTFHELGQIIYLRSDWSIALVQIVWKWNDGDIPPLRLLAEIGIIGGGGCSLSSQILRRLNWIFVAIDLYGYQIPLKSCVRQNKSRD
jgi:hypothetical protein